MKRALLATPMALLLLIVAIVGGAPAIAQSTTRSVTWQRFDVDLDVRPDGSLNVTETQVIQFTGTFQEGYRVVPLDRTSGATNVSVAELVNGQPLAYRAGSERPNTFATSTDQDGLHIDWWFPPTTNAVRTFVVRYTALSAIRIYDGGDQLQWRAIYADRTGPVTASNITVHLPGAADPGSVQTAWYTLRPINPFGALRSNGAGVVIDGSTVRFTLSSLDANTGAEVRVQFPHGLLTTPPPAWQQDADRADAIAQSLAPIGTYLSLVLTLAITVGGGVGLFWLWFSKGRDPLVGDTPPRLEQPPSDLPAPLAGTLIDEVAGTREVVAALVDMADRGLIELRDTQNPQLVGSTTDVRITRRVPLDDPRLRQYERALLQTLYGPSTPDDVWLSQAKQRFQAAIPTIDAALYAAVTNAGYFVRNPETTRRIWYSVSTTICLLGIGAAIGAGVWLGAIVPVAVVPGIALTGVGIIGLFVSARMPRRTPQGALEAARWRAFGAYLKETLRSSRPGTALPPRYLPYAVAFGTERAFVRHLEQVGTPPPQWYGGYGGPGPIVILPGGRWHAPVASQTGSTPGTEGRAGVSAPPAPNPQLWSDALAGLLNAASEAMAHGGGSGGWSGGGFGGGGGGGGGHGGFR